MPRDRPKDVPYGGRTGDPPKPSQSSIDKSRIPDVSRLEPRRQASGADTKTVVALFELDGGSSGSDFVTDVRGYDVYIPFAASLSEINVWSVNGVAFSMTFDLWRCAYSARPAVVANTILPAPIVIAAATGYNDRILANVNKTIVGGDIIKLYVTSVSSLKRGVVALTMERSI